jgi:hypothetical protein
LKQQRRNNKHIDKRRSLPWIHSWTTHVNNKETRRR